MEEIKQEPKLNLEQEIKSPLMVYFMIARQQQISIPDEKCVAVLAYNLEDALAKAQIETQGLSLTYHGQKIPVTELISKLHLENVVSPETTDESTEQSIIEEIPKEKMALSTFKASLLMILNEYIKEQEDKENLKKIISKL